MRRTDVVLAVVMALALGGIALMLVWFLARTPRANEHGLVAEPEFVAHHVADIVRDAPPERVEVTRPITRTFDGVGPVEHTLRGRVIDSAGAPVAACSIECDLRALRGKNWLWTARRPTTTDVDGRFELRTDFGRGVSSVHVEIRTAPWPAAATSARAAVDIETDDDSELGDLVLATMSTLASGVVQNEHGVPIVGALISARDEKTRGSSLLLAETDLRGRFELRGSVHGDLLRISAQCDGYLRSDERFLDVGANDVMFVLDAAGALRGEVWVDAWIPLDQMNVTCKPSATMRAARMYEVRTLEYDGSFAFDELRPGSYDVAIVAGSTREVLFEATGLEVGPHSNGWNSALSPIDLREQVRGADLTLFDARSNRLVGGAWIHVDADGKAHQVFCGKGKATLLTRAARVDVVVRARGFALQPALDVRESCEIALAPAPKVHFGLPPAFEWPAESLRLSLELEWIGGFDETEVGEVLQRARGAVRHSSVSLARRGSVAAALEPGVYRASLAAHSVTSRGSLRALPRSNVDRTFEFEVRPFETSVECSVEPPSELRAEWKAWAASNARR